MRFSAFSDSLKKISYNRLRFVFLVLSGAFTGAMLVFTRFGFFEWITLVPAAVVLLFRGTDKKVRLRSLYFDGFAFFYTYYIVCFHWFVYLYPLEFIDGMTKSGALAVVLLAWFGLSLLQALMGGFVFVIAGALFRCRLPQKYTFIKIFVCSGLWAVYEWSQTLGWWGVPWGRLPIGQSHYIVGLQTASWFGSYFITFMLVAVNFLLAYALVLHKEWRVAVIIAAAFLMFQYVSGTLIWFGTDITSGKKMQAACVQGNISSSDKWDSESNLKTEMVYKRLISEAAEHGAELVVLPETAFPYDLDSPSFSNLDEEFSVMSEKYGIYLLVGAFTAGDGSQSLNSLICYTPDGERAKTVYSKRHLVPFGEYVPMRPIIETLFPPLADLVLSSDDVDAGEGTNVIDAGDIGLGGLICFDSIYENLTYMSVRDGAKIICLSTNDSWFYDSAALYMHNAQAQLRAIESGRYVVRSANTGISTIISPRGEVISMLEPLVTGNLYGTVYARENMTLYTLTGNSFVYVTGFFLLAIVCENVISKLKNKNVNKKI